MLEDDAMSAEKTWKWILAVTAGALLALPAVALTPSDAEACGNSMRYDDVLGDSGKKPRNIEMEKPPQLGSVIRAEQAWNKGDWKNAIKEALLAHPTLAKRSRSYKSTDDAEMIRAAWIVASSITRANGDYTLDKNVRLEPDVDKKRLRVDWAVETLTWMLEKNEGDPLFTMLLAESLARTTEGEEKSLAMLEGLAKEDLMPDGYGWATLAALHTRAKKSEAAATAAKRCNTVGLDKKVCAGSSIELLAKADVRQPKSKPRPKSKSKSASKAKSM